MTDTHLTGYDAALNRARVRAQQLQEFYGHLVVYTLVCTLLVIIDLATGSSASTFIGLDWAFWPIGGWGLGLALHGASVALFRDR